jgi:hypothetical protein
MTTPTPTPTTTSQGGIMGAGDPRTWSAAKNSVFQLLSQLNLNGLTDAWNALSPWFPHMFGNQDLLSTVAENWRQMARKVSLAKTSLDSASSAVSGDAWQGVAKTNFTNWLTQTILPTHTTAPTDMAFGGGGNTVAGTLDNVLTKLRAWEIYCGSQATQAVANASLAFPSNIGNTNNPVAGKTAALKALSDAAYNIINQSNTVMSDIQTLVVNNLSPIADKPMGGEGINGFTPYTP